MVTRVYKKSELVERVEDMPEQNKLFLDFLIKRMDTKICDIRYAVSHEDIEIFCNDLDSYLDGLKTILQGA